MSPSHEHDLIAAGLRAIGAGMRVGSVVRAVQCAISLGLGLSVGVCTTAHSATIGDQLAQCAGIAAADRRLACYDSLAARSAGGRAPMAGATAAAGTTDLPGATAPSGNPNTAGAAGNAPSSALPVAPSNFAENDPKNFGLSRAQLHETIPGPAAIQARIAKVLEPEPGHAIIVLDNEQTWSCSDDDGRLDPGGLVTIKRGAVGSFTMLTSSNHVYKVHRVR
jgi:hypothetical protein